MKLMTKQKVLQFVQIKSRRFHSKLRKTKLGLKLIYTYFHEMLPSLLRFLELNTVNKERSLVM